MPGLNGENLYWLRNLLYSSGVKFLNVFPSGKKSLSILQKISISFSKSNDAMTAPDILSVDLSLFSTNADRG